MRTEISQKYGDLVSLVDLIETLARMLPNYVPDQDINIRRRVYREIFDLMGTREVSIIVTRYEPYDPDSVNLLEYAPLKPVDNEIPASGWSGRRFDFRSGNFEQDAKGIWYGSSNARIRVSDARELWPHAFQDLPLTLPERASRPAHGPEVGSASPTSKAGRKPEYDETEFFLLCAWEADANHVPEVQAEMRRRMQELLSVIWGEQNVPNDTWMKERLKRLYSVREKYERGRQQMPGE